MRRYRYTLKTKGLRAHNNFYILKNKAVVFLKNNTASPTAVRQRALLWLDGHRLNLSQLHTFCLYTGRVRYTITDAHISRIIFVELARAGHLYGYTRATW